MLLFGYETWLIAAARWGVAVLKALAAGSKGLSPAAADLSCVTPITPRSPPGRCHGNRSSLSPQQAEILMGFAAFSQNCQ